MTKTVSLVFALALFINEFTLISNARILENKYFTSNLVFLMAVCLLLKGVNIFPKILWRKLSPVCLVLEIITTLLILECSLVHVWQQVQEYLLLNSDGLLAQLAEHQSLDWIICQVCCGKRDCSVVFADLVLKLCSFAVLAVVCCFVS